jgi:hypothetical protein
MTRIYRRLLLFYIGLRVAISLGERFRLITPTNDFHEAQTTNELNLKAGYATQLHIGFIK